jgi:rfaE bifunctional protein kinase chain/domain
VIYSSGEVVFSSTQLMAQAERREEVTAGRLEWLCERHEIDRAGLESVVRQFAGKHVVVVGDLVLDRYVACDADEVASEAPIMSLRKLGEAEHVGGAAIVARHIAALGGSACLLSAVGHDAAGDRARNVLDDEHVEHHLLEIRETTATKTRFHVDDTKLFKLDEAECSPLDSRAEMDAASYLTRQTRDADAVIFCDFGCGMLTGGLLNRVMPTISRTGTITTADVSGSRSGLTRFSHVDLLTPTERELRSALPDFEEGLSTAAWKLLERTQARHLFVTLG